MAENIEEVVLLDDDGKENRFEHILTFIHEGEKYVALATIPEDDSAIAEDEAEVVLLHVVNQGGEDTYKSIDNEVLLNEVFDEFLDLMDEIDEEDEN